MDLSEAPKKKKFLKKVGNTAKIVLPVAQVAATIVPALTRAIRRYKNNQK